MRVFPDTYVLFAALATRGLCADLVRALLAEHDLVVGEAVLDELRRNLRVKLKLPAERESHAIGFLIELERAPAKPRPAKLPPRVDAADAAILESAAAARAEVFVTGDQALLKLGDYAGVSVLSPRGLWERLQKAGR